MAGAIVVLGSQRFARTLGATVAALAVRGKIALVTSGWRERESEDEELREHLATDTVNLRLHQRAEQLFTEDRELARAHRKKQELLRFKQDFYRVRLEHELDAHHVIRNRAAPAEVHAEEETASIAAIRALDQYHLEQCARVHAEFEAALRPPKRPAVLHHRAEIAHELASCSAIAIAGGHVASIVNRLRLFALCELVGEQTVFAWSGGAMAISERIVLFHDNTPEGPVASEILDRGMGLIRDLVVLPEPEQRLDLGERERVGVMARRFAPARVLAFPAGAHVTWRDGGLRNPSTEVVELCADGEARPFTEESAA